MKAVQKPRNSLHPVATSVPDIYSSFSITAFPKNRFYKWRFSKKSDYPDPKKFTTKKIAHFVDAFVGTGLYNYCFCTTLY